MKAVESASIEKESGPAKPVDLVKKHEERKRLQGCEEKPKRTNIACEICKQRYPMLIMNARDSYKTFICSRCKKVGEVKGSMTCDKCNVVVPSHLMSDHLDSHLKAELKSKFRERERKRAQLLQKKVIPIEFPKARTQKYQCSQCSKKYAIARQLAMHVRSAHGDSMDNICAVCDQDMETNEKLQEHLLRHSGLHQCDKCLLIFKNEKILAVHVASKHYIARQRLPAE